MPARMPHRESLVGDWVRLSPLRSEEFGALYRAIGRPAVFAGGFGGGPAGLVANQADFAGWAASYFPFEAGIVYAVHVNGGPDDGMLLGTSTLSDFDLEREHAHIGWTAYDPRVWGTAVNPECKLLMLGHAFDHGFGRVRLQADSRNARSRGAIAKLGATFEGIVRRDMIRADGTWRDSAVFSVIVDEWPVIRAGLVRRLESFAGPPVVLAETAGSQ